MENQSRSPSIKNISEISPMDFSHGKKFGGIRKRLAASTGGKELGCSWYELQPGRQSFPHHYHFGNEEAFFILSGSGEIRLGNERFPISAGDYVACPAGEASGHSIRNTGTGPLQYIAVSTANGVDVVVYPDSKKFSCVGGADMQKGLKAAPFMKLVKDQPSVEYFLDEE